MIKKISILGSTGSIGVNTLEIVKNHPDKFQVIGLSCGKNISLLETQIQAFRPQIVCVEDEKNASLLKEKFSSLEVVCGKEGLISIATYSEVEWVISALVGARGIEPTYAAIQTKKNIALANKEVLVAAGSFIMHEVKKQNISFLPIDSEHSALFQILEEENKDQIQKVTLTASGGPFLHKSKEHFSNITQEEALKHPNWSMGQRISIDSATLMNKGFEVIEAFWLFDLKPSQIEVVIHPQSIVHSLISYRDGNTLACLSIPDMKASIAYALSYPDRISTEVPTLDLTKVKNLSFFPPDDEKFPLLLLAFQALKEGGVKPCLLNAADEVAVEAFLKGQISFDHIPSIVKSVLDEKCSFSSSTLEEILAADSWGRQKAWNVISDMLR